MTVVFNSRIRSQDVLSHIEKHHWNRHLTRDIYEWWMFAWEYTRKRKNSGKTFYFHCACLGASK